MARQLLSLEILLIALVGSACAPVAKAPYNTLRISEQEFKSKIKTIALAAVVISRDIEKPDQVTTKFESLLAAKLRDAGFSVVPSRESEEIRERMTRQMIGYFDPRTEELMDEAKFKTVREHILRELSVKFKVDAVLHPSIRLFKAPWSLGTANWHGTSESIKPGWMQFFDALTNVSSSGSVGALSLVVDVEDIHGTRLYSNAGGIQVLSKISAEGKSVPVPQSELLTNDERNVMAVDIALGALIGKPVFTETRTIMK